MPNSETTPQAEEAPAQGLAEPRREEGKEAQEGYGWGV